MSLDQVTILLADDDLDDQELLIEAIGTIDELITVKTFRNGQEVIDYLFSTNHQPPALIVLDYNMPLASGLEVLELIEQEDRLKQVPRIVWSTSNSSTSKEECLKTGALKYLVKPNNFAAYKQIATEMIALCNG